MFPSMHYEDKDKWEIEEVGEEEAEAGIMMVDGEENGNMKGKEKEEELLIDFGDVAELEAPVPTLFEPLDANVKSSAFSSVTSQRMDDFLGSPVPVKTVMSTTATHLKLTLPPDSTKSPGTIATSITTPNPAVTLPSISTPSTPPSPPFYESPTSDYGIQMIDNDDDDLTMHIQTSVPSPISTHQLSRNESENIEKGMTELVVTESNIRDVKHHSPVEQKSLGLLPRGEKKAGDFGLC